MFEISRLYDARPGDYVIFNNRAISKILDIDTEHDFCGGYLVSFEEGFRVNYHKDGSLNIGSSNHKLVCAIDEKGFSIDYIIREGEE